jgi:hypothetical protein
MGYYFIFEINRSILRNEMREIVKGGGSKYQIIQVTNSEISLDFQRIEEDEIYYNGRLYDVISESRTAETTTFFCIEDVKEQSLLIGFIKICKNKQLVSLDDYLIKIALPEIHAGFDDFYFTIHKFPEDSFSLHSRTILPPSPPPKAIC